MKIKKVLIILLVLMSLLSSTVLGYSTQEYSIELPSYYQDLGKSGKYVNFGAKERDPNIVISCDNNTNKLTSLNGVTNVEMKESFVDPVIKGLEEQLGSKVQLIEYKVDKLVGCDSLFVKVKVEGYEYYQEYYQLYSDNYVYNITITSRSEEYFSSQECRSMLNSFKINDTVTQTKTFDLWQSIKSGLKWAIIFAIVGIVITIYKKINKEN